MTQQIPQTYKDAGQFYFALKKTWLTKKNIFSKNSKIILMDKKKTVDIDNLNDFKDGHSVLLVRQYVPFSLNKVFPFFAEAKNLERITPDLLHFRIEKMSTPEIQKGTLIDYNLKIHGFPAKWKTLIEDWQPPVQFVDTQLKGPYKLWHHTHSFAQMGKGTLLTDKVRFKLPFGFLGHAVAQTFVQKDVESIFKYRREVMSEVKFSE